MLRLSPCLVATAVATAMILVSHIQTLTIIGSMQLGWPLVIKQILASINMPIMGYLPLACLLNDPVLKSLLSYSETGAVMLLLVSTWLVARRRKNKPDAREFADRAERGSFAEPSITEREASAEYFLSALFSVLFTFGLRASASLWVRYEEDPTRQAISRGIAVLCPSFMLFLLWRFTWLLRIHRKAVEAAKGLSNQENVTRRTLTLLRRERHAAAAVRYLVERYAFDDTVLKDDDVSISFAEEKWPYRSQWQIVVWVRQLLLFFTSFVMDCFAWYAAPQVSRITRYVFAGVAVAILVCVWRLQVKRQPYILREQHWLEVGLYAVDIIAIFGACVYGALTYDGQVQEAPGRAGLEIGLGALLVLSAVVAILLIARGVANERRVIKVLYDGFVQDCHGGKMQARRVIDGPVNEAIEDGAIRIINCDWLLSAEADVSLPRPIWVVAQLSVESVPGARGRDSPSDTLMSVEEKSEIIKLLAESCRVSSVCITVEQQLDADPSSIADPGQGSRSVEVTFHLSTFQEVAPLTLDKLRRKAADVRQTLATLNAVVYLPTIYKDVRQALAIRVVAVQPIREGHQPFLPRCQDLPDDAFLTPKAASELFNAGTRSSECTQRRLDLCHAVLATC